MQNVSIRISLLLVLLFQAWAPCAAAEPLTVVTEDWTPYNYSVDGTVTGVVTEIVRAVLDRAELEYTITSYPWARAYSIAQKKPNTLIYSIIKLPERAPLFKWIKIDGLSVEMYLFSPKGRTDIAPANLEDAKKYKIGVTRQTSTHHFLLEKGFVEGGNLFPVNSEEQNMLKAQPSRRRIDLSTGDRLSMAAWLKKAGFPPDYWNAVLLLFKKDLYMGMSPSTPDETVEQIRASFKQIRQDGTMAEIVHKYEQMLKHRTDENQ